MATEIVHVDTGTAPASVAVRADVASVFVIVTTDGRPVAVSWEPRPAAGVLDVGALVSRVERRASPARSRTGSPVSVIVCTHERPDDLARCLERLAPLQREGHQVVVVDNAPATERTAGVAAAAGVLRVLEPHKGLDRARNAGAAAARHDLIAFVDDDVVVASGWIEAIQECFQDPAVGCSTGLVLPLELETEAQEQYELYSQHRRRLTPYTYSKTNTRPSAAGMVGIGGNMAFRRGLLADLAGFDVRLDAGTGTRSGGDTDIFARVLDAGWAIRYSPDMMVFHRHRRTMRELRSCVYGYGVGVYSLLTKRCFEHGDPGALVTAARWLVGPIAKTVRARALGRRTAPWTIVLAETAGAACGPIFFARETLRLRRSTAAHAAGHMMMRS